MKTIKRLFQRKQKPQGTHVSADWVDILQDQIHISLLMPLLPEDHPHRYINPISDALSELPLSDHHAFAPPTPSWFFHRFFQRFFHDKQQAPVEDQTPVEDQVPDEYQMPPALASFESTPDSENLDQRF